ncbi:MAG: CDGSH iron-sulfur domain-containing protein [Gemmatimonadota bacterium]|nr:CDGSH iron-sulfur domain-containing protein [Gemmatimonadota bacterium]
MSRGKTYEGEAVDIRFEPRRCIHSGNCVRGLGAVFQPGRKPWIDANGASADEIARVVARCPSGALSMRRRDGAPEEEPDERVSVRVVPNGPVHVRGDLTVEIPDESEPVRETRVALCRCGQSSNKPFCDNSHQEAGFVGSDLRELPERAVSEPPEPAGATLSPRANGCLFIDGTVRFTAADGSVGWIARPALCRCGRSDTKPFCDGSHKDESHPDGPFVSPGPAL